MPGESSVKVVVNIITRDSKLFVDAAKKALSVTRLEQGCENSNLYQEIGNTAEAGTHRFVIISKWKNEEHLDNHMKTAHVKELAKSFGDHTSVEHMRRYQKIF